MTTVAILPERTAAGTIAYRAVAGGLQSLGKSAGEALDALTAQMPAEDKGTLVIVQHQHPDRFFTAAQRQRLQDLMVAWRAARDQGTPFPAADRTELDALIDAEVQATTLRTAALLEVPKE
jgi:hypothetical protein